APASAGRAAPRVVRRPGVSLRQPPPLVPEEPQARRGRGGSGRAREPADRARERFGHARGGGGLRLGARAAGVRRADRAGAVTRLVEQFEAGLEAPICLTWELTYACNLACVHCLSSSGR